MTKTRLQQLLRLYRRKTMPDGDRGIHWYIERHLGGFDYREILALDPEDYDEWETTNDYSLALLSEKLGELDGTEVIRIHRFSVALNEFVDWHHVDLTVLPEVEDIGFRYEDEFGEVRVASQVFGAWQVRLAQFKARLNPEPLPF